MIIIIIMIMIMPFGVTPFGVMDRKGKTKICSHFVVEF